MGLRDIVGTTKAREAMRVCIGGEKNITNVIECPRLGIDGLVGGQMNLTAFSVEHDCDGIPGRKRKNVSRGGLQ
jgi:cytoskeletal protein CcmA (bactofilin family)